MAALRMLVTGGAGFIGSHYVRGLLGDAWGLERPRQVVVLDKLTYAGQRGNLDEVTADPRLRFVQGDVCDPPVVHALVAEADVVVHLAAESHVDRSIEHAGDFVRTNVVGTHTILEAARRNRTSTVVVVSTDEVYGSITSGSWTEDQPLLPSSPYSASKASGDLLARAYHHTHGLDVRVTRGSNTYGPYQHPEKLIPRFLTNLLVGAPLPLYGDGRNVREWLHVDDHCRGIHLVLCGGRPGRTYNVGGGAELTNRELTDVLVRATGGDPASVVPVPDRPGHDRRYSVDDNRIREELGYRPQVPFEEGMAATVEWYRGHRVWWEPLKRSSP